MELLHSRYGKLSWDALFEPAIKIASGGFKVSPYLARSLAAAVKVGFVPPSWFQDSNGDLVREGALVRNESLASTMQRIARSSPGALYVELARDIVSSVQDTSTPGTISEDDLKNYNVIEREPLCAKYHRIRLCAFPPPSYGGVAVLEMLGLLDQLHAQFPDFLDAHFVHLFVEAGRIAEADRADIVGDPDTGRVSVTALLDPKYLQQRAKFIDLKQSIKDPVEGETAKGSLRPTCLSAAMPPPPSTSQIAIVDRWGAALSMTTTINVNFGSWLTVDGFFLNNAMTNFTCAANAPAGSKRPETSMVPVIAMDNARHTILVGGSAGGGEIVDYVAQAVLELVHRVPPLGALDVGHVSTARAPYSGSAGLVELEESRAIASLADQLRKLGHNVRVAPLQSGLGFLKWQDGRWFGAADPRRDGDWVILR